MVRTPVQFLRSGWRTLGLISAHFLEPRDSFAWHAAPAWLATVRPSLGAAVLLFAAIGAGCNPHGAFVPLRVEPRNPAFDRVMDLQAFDHDLLSLALFQESNVARVTNGAKPLIGLTDLDHAADMQANYLALTLTVGHYSMFPREHRVIDRVDLAGLDPARVAENAIMLPANRAPDDVRTDYTYAEFAAHIVDGWMNSPGHRANLLDPSYTHLGCAARLAHGFRSGDRRIFATEVFYLAARPP
jgi:uncharacterized protein YkwD